MAELLDSLDDSAVGYHEHRSFARANSRRSGKSLLTAEWRNLVMLNYQIDPQVLAPLVPHGTKLDLFGSRALVSVVGFEFLNARWCGLTIPFHQNFPEVNLRFYVQRRTANGWRRGVVFVKEIAPRLMVAQVARRLYHENYCCRAMRHEIVGPESAAGGAYTARYSWREAGRWNQASMTTTEPFAACEAGSPEAFVVEHYWCYTRQPDGATREYRVEHPAWRIATADRCELSCDVAQVYGRQFVPCLSAPPVSAFLVDGSAVVVHPGSVI